MNYAPAQQISAARHIARSAQRRIKEKTGMRVNLLLCPGESPDKTPEDMMGIIALTLGMSDTCYRMKTHSRNIAELRFLCTVFLRRHFPAVTLNQIASLYGGKDHTSILYGLKRAYNLIYTGDLKFMKKYNQAQKAVNIWLRKEA
jgi:chromosomal replication initiation ATPase DnaA